MQLIQSEQVDQIYIISICREEALNALHTGLLHALVKELENIPPSTRVVIIRGKGEKAFSAGADIKEMAASTPAKVKEIAWLGQKLARLLEEVPFVTIAAVNGIALGAGFEIALGCDFIYAAESAKFGLPEVKIGLIPGFGGIRRLQQAVGKRMAKELMMTGRMLTAKEAKDLRLVNRVVVDPFLMKEVMDTAKEISSLSKTSVTEIKFVIEKSDQSHHLNAELEVERFQHCFTHGDGYQDMKKFLEKKK